MTLTPTDAELYYRLWVSLLDFVNETLSVVPAQGKLQGAEHIDPWNAKKIADTLWDNVRMIDGYLRLYGDALLEEERRIVGEWKRRSKGHCILELNLMPGSVFIAVRTEEVHLAKGDHFLLGGNVPLPSATHHAPRGAPPLPGCHHHRRNCLPVQYFFDGGYSRDLKEIYMGAKRAGSVRKSI